MPLPDELERDLAPGQYDNVRALIGEELDLPRGLQVQFARGGAPTPATVRSPNVEAPLDGECIGGVVLTDVEDILNQPSLWVDIALVVLHEGHWRAPPLTIEPDMSQPDCLWLRLDLEQADPEFIEALRRALPRATWMGRSDGLGILIAGAIDLDASKIGH